MKIVAVVPMKLNNRRLPQKTQRHLQMENHCATMFYLHS